MTAITHVKSFIVQFFVKPIHCNELSEIILMLKSDLSSTSKKYNDTQHDIIQYNNKKRDTLHNGTQHYQALNIVMLRVGYAKCHK